MGTTVRVRLSTFLDLPHLLANFPSVFQNRLSWSFQLHSWWSLGNFMMWMVTNCFDFNPSVTSPGCGVAVSPLSVVHHWVSHLRSLAVYFLVVQPIVEVFQIALLVLFHACCVLRLRFVWCVMKVYLIWCWSEVSVGFVLSSCPVSALFLGRAGTFVVGVLQKKLFIALTFSVKSSHASSLRHYHCNS